MTDAEFIEMATGNGVDSTDFRSWLVEKFKVIHRKITCAAEEGTGYYLADSILKQHSIPGPVVECGCYKGGLSAKLSLVCKATERQLWLLDSFQGLPNVDVSYDSYISPRKVRFTAGWYCGNYPEVYDNILTWGEVDACIFVKGWVEETLPSVAISPQLVFVDVDIIEPARACLCHFWPRLAGSQFFTHEAIFKTYMESFLDRNWWLAELGEEPPQVAGYGDRVGLPNAEALACLYKTAL